MKNLLRKIYNKWKFFKANIFPSYFISSPFWSSIYYLFFSSEFRRETHAVLSGRVKHLKDAKKAKSSFYTLIRNIHRIEKGLLMRPRREVFATEFIKETVDNFETLFEPLKCTIDSQMKWAYDVLSEYFKVTGSHIIVDRQRERFKNIIMAFTQDGVTSIPYFRLEKNRPDITYDDFYKLTKFRRSVRWFLNKRVPHDLIDKAILAANQSPSACNRQPFEYRIIDDPELLNTVVNIPMGIKGYQNNVPAIVVVVGNLDAYFAEQDRHVIYVDASLANMSFMLALETLGLASCSINWPDIEALESRMEKALKLEKYQRPIMCMAVGFPDPEGMVAYSEKRDIDLLRKYN